MHDGPTLAARRMPRPFTTWNSYFCSTMLSESCGRAITCTLCTSPAARAAAAPASTAARTLPTSPVTYTEHRPLPTLFQPTNFTLAAFSIASVACTRATRPCVSIIPIASLAIVFLLLLPLAQHALDERIVGPRDHMRGDELAHALGRR